MRHVVTRYLMLLLPAACAFSQSAPPTEFEAATIKPASGNPGIECKGGRQLCIEISPLNANIYDAPLPAIIAWAYDVPNLMVDAPQALKPGHFNISAKSSRPATEPQMQVMMQKLLAQRFGLEVHRQPREMPCLVMTLAKGGPKFQPEDAPGPFGLERAGMALLQAHHARMTDLANGIASEIGQPVVDQTGLTGRYEIRLNLTPYLTTPEGPGRGAQLDMLSILFTGFQDLLGLKLDAKKAPVEMLIVDKAEKVPTEN